MAKVIFDDNLYVVKTEDSTVLYCDDQEYPMRGNFFTEFSSFFTKFVDAENALLQEEAEEEEEAKTISDKRLKELRKLTKDLCLEFYENSPAFHSQ